VEANSTGGQGLRRAAAPSDDDEYMLPVAKYEHRIKTLCPPLLLLTFFRHSCFVINCVSI
jgi:hypothetical protein